MSCFSCLTRLLQRTEELHIDAKCDRHGVGMVLGSPTSLEDCQVHMCMFLASMHTRTLARLTLSAFQQSVNSLPSQFGFHSDRPFQTPPDLLQPVQAFEIAHISLWHTASGSFFCCHRFWDACYRDLANFNDRPGTQMFVVIIGAGFAGLSAARTLQAGRTVQVTVLEGSSRVGGRAHTLQV